MDVDLTGLGGILGTATEGKGDALPTQCVLRLLSGKDLSKLAMGVTFEGAKRERR